MDDSVEELIKKNGFAFLVGLGSVALLSWLYLSSNETASAWVKHINNGAYDQLLRANIAIDDDSISEQGRWPWSRERITALVTKLEQMHAAVIALDIVFSESEKNVIQQAMKESCPRHVKLGTCFCVKTRLNLAAEQDEATTILRAKHAPWMMYWLIFMSSNALDFKRL